jgi:hypothetical protein
MPNVVERLSEPAAVWGSMITITSAHFGDVPTALYS